MKICVLFFVGAFFFLSDIFAQQPNDSIKQLESIVVKGFESNAKLVKIPASISVVNEKQFHAYSNFSMLPAFNAIPGVRMEERSPGSYRFSIRGSLLRSPFGVRNVKMYLNDFMLTDAGGNTYLNLLDINQIGQAEVIKGPSGSLYGAGTGGAVLMGTPSVVSTSTKDTSERKVGLATGSFGRLDEFITYKTTNKYYSNEIIQSHNQSDGYREQSRMRKDNIQWRFTTSIDPKIKTELLFMFSDLYYQTPGGLTLAQYQSNPQSARPATSTLPSAVSQHTAIFNRTFLAGLSQVKKLSEKWTSHSSITASFTRFKNPFITNFENRKETNLGVRSSYIYENKSLMHLRWVSGLEHQSGKYFIDSSGNNKGISDGNNIIDKILAKQAFIFSHANFDPINFIHIQSGFSINGFKYAIDRTKGIPDNGNVKLNFDPQFLPRIAAMLDIYDGIGFYYQLSKGFSAPSIAEIRPSAGGLYTDLQAEHGLNSEFGIKAALFSNKLTWNLTWFDFQLKDAIVRQTNASGAEYFVNAGSTIQKGFETEISLVLHNKPSQKVFNFLRLNSSYTNNHFNFRQYKIGSNVYDGKILTGVPHEVGFVSIETNWFKKIYLLGSLNYVSSIPLNDANTSIANRYRVLQIKSGYKINIDKKTIDLFALFDNVGNEKYSLGNDLNAFGNRYYNAAPLSNFVAGINFSF